MSVMRTITVDKIASVTQACGLSHDIRIAPEIACEEGLVLVVEILNSKANYNTLELTSGRMAKVVKGDIVVGALGHRKALFGYSGHIPTTLQPGDIVQMLNIGGVLGICDSATPDKGKPFDCKVLGTVLTFPFLGERIGVPAKVGYMPLDYDAALKRARHTRGGPGRHLHGGGQDGGRGRHHCAHAPSRPGGRRLQGHGVSLRRDIMAFEDSGARRTMLFTDLGIVTTTEKVGPSPDPHMLTEMAAGLPDAIVFELGDGLLRYLRRAIHFATGGHQEGAHRGVVLSANDPVAAWGGVKLLRERFGIEPCVVTGPATDNQVGVEICRQQLQVEAFNAISNPADLGDHVIASLGLHNVRESSVVGE